MSEDLDAILGQFGIAPLTGGGNQVEDRIDAAVPDGLDPYMVITTREETRFDELPPDASGPPSASTVEVPDMVVRDVYETYFAMSEDQQRAVHERLFVNGFFGVNPDTATNTQLKTYLGYIDNPLEQRDALNAAVRHFAVRGVDPLSEEALPAGAMPVLEPEEEPVAKRYTEDQIGAYADTAAQRVFGRNASASEKQMAVGVFRRLETDKASTPGVSDVEARFRSTSPEEAAGRSMSETMSMFQKIVAGAIG